MPLGEQVGELTANHLGNDKVGGQILGIPGADVLAVTHDGDFVGNPEDFVHLVRDVDDGNAVGLQILDDSKQCFHLVGSQGGGGLVQNQNLTVGGDGLGDFHGLHLGNAELAHLLMGVKIHPNLLQQGIGILIHLLVVNHGDEAQKLLHGIAAQENILAHGTGGDGLQLLMHHGDAHVERLQGILDADFLALVNDFALVHAVDAEHTLHQCGLTGTVFTHQCVNGTGSQTQLCMIQRLNTGEGLADTAHFQAVFTHRANLLFPFFQDLFSSQWKTACFSVFHSKENLEKWVGCFQPTRKEQIEISRSRKRQPSHSQPSSSSAEPRPSELQRLRQRQRGTDQCGRSEQYRSWCRS